MQWKHFNVNQPGHSLRLSDACLFPQPFWVRQGWAVKLTGKHEPDWNGTENSLCCKGGQCSIIDWSDGREPHLLVEVRHDPVCLESDLHTFIQHWVWSENWRTPTQLRHLGLAAACCVETLCGCRCSPSPVHEVEQCFTTAWPVLAPRLFHVLWLCFNLVVLLRYTEVYCMMLSSVLKYQLRAFNICWNALLYVNVQVSSYSSQLSNLFEYHSFLHKFTMIMKSMKICMLKARLGHVGACLQVVLSEEAVDTHPVVLRLDFGLCTREISQSQQSMPLYLEPSQVHHIFKMCRWGTK